MAETNKSQLISKAELIEAINADSIISVSLGAGQPQKNVKLSTLASVVAGLIIRNDTASRSYGGSESTLKIIKLNGLGGSIRFEVLSKKTDTGSENVKSECSLLFSNGNIVAKKCVNNHGLSYHNDGSSISIYANSANLAYAFVTISILSGMGYIDNISAQQAVTLPSGVISL